jgi:uncharacterized phage protein (TIGR01671 family)
MREIKFRAWGIIDKNMMYFSNWQINTNTGASGSTRSGLLFYPYKNEPYYRYTPNGIDSAYPAILMQFTGLKDCKGKEIFEGDIVANSHWHNCEVKYKEGIYYPLLANWNGGYMSPKEWEVIGNIYEDSELLEATK